jgi:hypothetical protein
VDSGRNLKKRKPIQDLNFEEVVNDVAHNVAKKKQEDGKEPIVGLM